MTKLHGVALKQLNNEVDDEKYEIIDIQTFPCLEWLPLDRVLIPILHELLGLGNTNRGMVTPAVLEDLEKQL